jgi:aminoglycoside/choline kinase family phosphotransferase
VRDSAAMSRLHHNDFTHKNRENFPRTFGYLSRLILKPGIQSLQKFNKTPETVRDARE